MCLLSRVDVVASAADLGQHVALAQDQEVLAVDLDLRAAVLGVEDLVALGDVERDALLAVLVPLAVADGEDLALLRLLLRGVGEHDAGSSRLVLLDRLDDQPIAQGLELHVSDLHSSRVLRAGWHSTGQSASAGGGDITGEAEVK